MNEFFEIRGVIRQRFKAAASLPAEDQLDAITAFADEFVMISGADANEQEKGIILEMVVSAFMIWRTTGKNKIRMRQLGKATRLFGRLVDERIEKDI